MKPESPSNLCWRKGEIASTKFSPLVAQAQINQTLPGSRQCSLRNDDSSDVCKGVQIILGEVFGRMIAADNTIGKISEQKLFLMS